MKQESVNKWQVSWCNTDTNKVIVEIIKEYIKDTKIEVVAVIRSYIEKLGYIKYSIKKINNKQESVNKWKVSWCK